MTIWICQRNRCTISPLSDSGTQNWERKRETAQFLPLFCKYKGYPAPIAANPKGEQHSSKQAAHLLRWQLTAAGEVAQQINKLRPLAAVARQVGPKRPKQVTERGLLIFSTVAGLHNKGTRRHTISKAWHLCIGRAQIYGQKHSAHWRNPESCSNFRCILPKACKQGYKLIMQGLLKTRWKLL